MAEDRSMSVDTRYVIEDKLGEGGMGAVFLVTDRLTGKYVALKQMLTQPTDLMFASKGTSSNHELALTQEFKVLASLRHPTIVSVLDYGFDDKNQPYFTMEYLPDAQSFTEAAENKSSTECVALLVQILQSLVYLHRRKLLHRDLKPSNVLVTDNKVKVLDFGICLVFKETKELSGAITGTFLYMAPEMLQKRQLSRSSDLYSFGLMAYEVLVGDLPFNITSIGDLIIDRLTKEIDFSAIDLEPNLVQVLEKLLQREPKARYQRASEVIQVLCEAVDIPVPIESVEIRESFLQAAKFVGRDTEMDTLAKALDEAIDGQGSTWLVGGESGVGKTRLLDELRILALVKGALVLHGQAVSEGGKSFQVWREPFRRLALYSDLTDKEAGVLKNFVPEIDDFLGKEIKTLDVTAGPAGITPLVKVLGKALTKTGKPIVVVLEDLQWAESNSVQLLHRLSQGLQLNEVLFLANFRDDERPHLPEELPAGNVLDLKRLDNTAITALSISMLGDSGGHSEVVTFLERETEGNPFFLVETVRVLAEQAGELSSIGGMQLPKKVIVGGVQEILQRRLARLPAKMTPLLHFAAVAGRQLDLRVIERLSEDVDTNEWLNECAEAAILDPSDEQWRFEHDKLREHILDGLGQNQLKKINRLVAEAVEFEHPDDPQYSAALSGHWAAAGDEEKELQYASIAGQAAFINGANIETIAFLERALELTLKQPETQQRDIIEINFRRILGNAYVNSQGYGSENVLPQMGRVKELSYLITDPEQLANVLDRLWAFYYARGMLEEALQTQEEILALGEKQQSKPILAAGNNAQAAAHTLLSNFEDGLKYSQITLDFYVTDPEIEQLDLNLYGNSPNITSKTWQVLCKLLLGFPDVAIENIKPAIDHSRSLGVPYAHSFALALFTPSIYISRDLKLLREIVQELDALVKENNFLGWMPWLLVYQGYFHIVDGGDKEAGYELINEGINLMKRGLEGSNSIYFGIFAETQMLAGDYNEALETIEEGFGFVNDYNSLIYEVELHRLKGECLLKTDTDSGVVETEYLTAIRISREQKAKWWQLRSSISLAKLWRSQEKGAEAKALLEPVYNWFTEGFDTIDLKAAKALLDELS